MTNPINPFEQPDLLTHQDFAEVMDEAFKDWLSRNPRVLPEKMPFVYKQIMALLVRTNAEQIDGFIAKHSQ